MVNLSSITVHKKKTLTTFASLLINYPFELTMQTTGMVSSKLLWNSTISTKGACFSGADIKNMYLDTPLDWYEYM
jgi:hypothetical protein